MVSAKVSVNDRTAYVEHWSSLKAQAVADALNEHRLGARLQERGESAGHAQTCTSVDAMRVGHVIVQLLLFGIGLGVAAAAKYVYLLCVILSYSLFYKAFNALLALRANVELLMATAILGSLVQGAFREAASVGVLVEAMTLVVWGSTAAVERRLKDSISMPPSTVDLQDGKSIPVSDLKQGDVFLVRAGDGVIADGTVVEGKGASDESRVTGEALPVTKQKGAKVFSGSVLQHGFLKVKADADVDASFQAKVLKSVQQAKDTISNTQLVVGKFAAWYTPIIITIAILVAVAQWNFTQFLVIIVAGCPCALLGAAPFVQAATLAILAKRHSLLVKETQTLESLARLKWLGFDKTGTITTGHFELVKMASVSQYSQEQLHQWAAAIETRDTHPLAQSLVQSYTGCLVAFAGWDGLPAVTHFQRQGRVGVRGVIDGQHIGIGNADFVDTSDIPLEGEAAELAKKWNAEGTVLFITVNEEVAGILLLNDSLRGETQGVIAKLKSLGVEPVLLTGDKRINADRAARAAGIATVHAGLLPDHKAEILLAASWGNDKLDHEKGLLKGQFDRGPIEVGFIGDGLNDCPALAHAHVGIVMQEIGSYATMDASSAVLQGSLGQLPAAVIVARRAQHLIIANILLALLINMSLIIAAIFFGVPLWLSVLMDNGSLLVVLANSLWPLCWRVEPISNPSEAEKTSNGGVIAFRDRESLLNGDGKNHIDAPVVAPGQVAPEAHHYH